jgi:4-alpha-glucanotransferase
MKRKCGVLLPVASLPSKYGIGCFSEEAYKFIDFLRDAGQSCWQILPLGQTGYGDSPYQSVSTFAGNPYFIDPDELKKAGYITQKDINACRFGNDPEYIDYSAIYKYRFRLLHKAYLNSPFALHPGTAWTDSRYDAERSAFEKFREDNADWLPDYALFCAVKAEFGGRSFMEWDDDIRLRRTPAMKKYRTKLEDEIRFYEFQQFIFDREWMAVKAYANRNRDQDHRGHSDICGFRQCGYLELSGTFQTGCQRLSDGRCRMSAGWLLGDRSAVGKSDLQLGLS